MQTLLTIVRADWGPALRAAAGRVAYVVACVIVAAEIAYCAGLATGRVVHRLSDLLAGLASGRIDRAETARAVVSWARATAAAVVTPEPEPAPSLADTFAAVAAAAAASDARLYRSVGESIARMRATLDEAETAETVTMACAAAETGAPAASVAPPALDALTVRDLRAMARARGIAGMGRARRADLIAALM